MTNLNPIDTPMPPPRSQASPYSGIFDGLFLTAPEEMIYTNARTLPIVVAWPLPPKEHGLRAGSQAGLSGIRSCHSLGAPDVFQRYSNPRVQASRPSAGQGHLRPPGQGRVLGYRRPSGDESGGLGDLTARHPDIAYLPTRLQPGVGLFSCPLRTGGIYRGASLRSRVGD